MKSKGAIVVSAIIEKLQLIAGIIILILFGLCTIMSLTDAELAAGGFLPFCIVCVAIGIVLIVFSRKRYRLKLEFKKYVSALSKDSTGSIANLATAVGTSHNVVKKNLDLMIKRKYFVNAYINQETNCIIIGNTPVTTNNQPIMNSNAPQTSQPVNAAQQAMPENEHISYTCKSCGGITRIVKGQSCECDFCGNPIN